MTWGAWQDYGASSSGRLLVAAGAALAATIIAERAYHRWRYRRFFALPAPAGENFALGHLSLMLSRCAGAPCGLHSRVYNEPSAIRKTEQVLGCTAKGCVHGGHVARLC